MHSSAMLESSRVRFPVKTENIFICSYLFLEGNDNPLRISLSRALLLTQFRCLKLTLNCRSHMIVYNHRALHTSIWEKSPCSATSNRIEEEEYPCFIYFYFNNDCTNQISCMLNEYTKWKWGYFMFMSCREWKLLVLRNAMEQALWVITSFFYTQSVL